MHITSFDQLVTIQPRSRKPIDIKDFKDFNLTPRRQTDSSTHSNINTNRKYFSFFGNLNNETKKLSSSNTDSSCKSSNDTTTLDSNSLFSPSSSSSSSSASSLNATYINDISIVTSPSNDPMTQEQDEITCRNLCNKLYRNSVAKNNYKILTIIFDYQEPVMSSSNLKNNKKFNVLKGQNVKVICDYDENYYLVAKMRDTNNNENEEFNSHNQIGFIPKEYTIDLNEIKQKALQMNSSNYFSNRHSLSCQNRINNMKKLNLKLTKL
jgi:hypothetical protein